MVDDPNNPGSNLPQPPVPDLATMPSPNEPPGSHVQTAQVQSSQMEVDPRKPPDDDDGDEDGEDDVDEEHEHEDAPPARPTRLGVRTKIGRIIPSCFACHVQQEVLSSLCLGKKNESALNNL